MTNRNGTDCCSVRKLLLSNTEVPVPQPVASVGSAQARSSLL